METLDASLSTQTIPAIVQRCVDPFFELRDSIETTKLRPHLRGQLVSTMSRGDVDAESLKEYAFRAWKKLLECKFTKNDVGKYFERATRASNIISKVCKSWDRTIEGYEHTRKKKEALDKIINGKTPGLRDGSKGTLVTLTFTTGLQDAVCALPEYNELETTYRTEEDLGRQVHDLIATFHSKMGSRPPKVIEGTTSDSVANQEVGYYLLDSDTSESAKILEAMTNGYSESEKAAAKYLGNYGLYRRILFDFKAGVFQPAKVSNYIAGVVDSVPDAGDYETLAKGAVSAANVGVLNYTVRNSKTIKYDSISELKTGLLEIIESNDFKVRVAAQPSYSQPFDITVFDAAVDPGSTPSTEKMLRDFKEFLKEATPAITVAVTVDEIKGHFITFIKDYTPTEEIVVPELTLPSPPDPVLVDKVYRTLGISENCRQLWDEYLHAHFSVDDLKAFRALDSSNAELMKAKAAFERDKQIQAAIRTITRLESGMAEYALNIACTIDTYKALFDDDNPLKSTGQTKKDVKKFSTHLAELHDGVAARNTLAKLRFQRARCFADRAFSQ